MTVRTVAELEGKMQYTRLPDYLGSRVWLSPLKDWFATDGGRPRVLRVDTMHKSTITYPPWRLYFEQHGVVFDEEATPPETVPLAPAEPMLRNNDGRATCCRCSAPTRSIFLFMSTAQVCTKCGF